MLNQDTAQPPRPFWPPRWGRINRFEYIPTKTDSQFLTKSLDFEAAAEKLCAAGLVANVPRRMPNQIVGGTCLLAGTDITTYIDGFVITRAENGEFIAAVAEKPGHGRVRKRVLSLASAVQEVLDIYRLRGNLR